jgi:Resolvase, N terminal domain
MIKLDQRPRDIPQDFACSQRQAVVYVRQSTVRQVLQHQESTRLQYALADRACQLGWNQDQVVVIDDDLGRSAVSTLHRPGFQRLVAEVGLGHVGLASRSRAWRVPAGIGTSCWRCALCSTRSLRMPTVCTTPPISTTGFCWV